MTTWLKPSMRVLPWVQRKTMLSTGSGGRRVVLDFTDLLLEASLLLAQGHSWTAA
jgi:hypothetical protein